MAQLCIYAIIAAIGKKINSYLLGHKYEVLSHDIVEQCHANLCFGEGDEGNAADHHLNSGMV